MKTDFAIVNMPRLIHSARILIILLIGTLGVLFLRPACDLAKPVSWNDVVSVRFILLFMNGVPLLGTDSNYLLVRDEYDRKIIYDQQLDKQYPYGTDMPLIFIGGVPRSGTTLMRAMLDAHPDIRCGEETRVIPNILALKSKWQKNAKETMRLNEAGVTDLVVDSAIASFILEIIVKHGKPAPILCNKDPFTLRAARYLYKLFPNAKFIMMIRDGRATVHSIISRKVTITGFDLKSFRQCLQKWNAITASMYGQCRDLGKSVCFPIQYEKLVLNPEKQLRALTEFLAIPWNNSLLHHEEYIGKEISLSKTEASTDQIMKPVYLDSMTNWVGHVPDDVIADIDKIAPMLTKLGYDPKSGPDNPPNYGTPSELVQSKVAKLQDTIYWNRKIKQFYNSSAAVSKPSNHKKTG